MTCICGHHAAVHRAMCGAPEGCDCNQFRKAPAIPDPFVDEAKARQDAEWLAGSEADTAERNLARAYLALREQVATLTLELRLERSAAEVNAEWWAKEKESLSAAKQGGG